MRLINADALTPITEEYVPTGMWVSWDEIQKTPEANIPAEILTLKESKNYWKERAQSYERTIVKIMRVLDGEDE